MPGVTAGAPHELRGQGLPVGSAGLWAEGRRAEGGGRCQPPASFLTAGSWLLPGTSALCPPAAPHPQFGGPLSLPPTHGCERYPALRSHRPAPYPSPYAHRNSSPSKPGPMGVWGEASAGPEGGENSPECTPSQASTPILSLEPWHSRPTPTLPAPTPPPSPCAPPPPRTPPAPRGVGQRHSSPCWLRAPAPQPVASPQVACAGVGT